MFTKQNPRLSNKELVGRVEALQGQISDYSYYELLKNVKALIADVDVEAKAE